MDLPHNDARTGKQTFPSHLGWPRKSRFPMDVLPPRIKDELNRQEDCNADTYRT